LSAWLEQAWLLRYLDRQLSSEETSWFEAYVLDKPELLASIEADLNLCDALAADAAQQARRFDSGDAAAAPDARTRSAGAASIDAIAANGGQPTGVGQADRHRQPTSRHANRPPAWLGLAASLLVGLGAGWIVSGARRPGSSTPAVMASPTRIVYDTMRGEAAPPRVEHAGSKSPYVLIEVAVPPGAQDVTLKFGAAPEQALTASPDGFVSFLVGRSELKTARNAQLAYRSGASLRTQTIDLGVDGG
jgi:hypothetical protein